MVTKATKIQSKLDEATKVKYVIHSLTLGIPSQIIFVFQSFYSHGSSSSHKLAHAISSSGRVHRQICLTCGRLAKQVGSSGFYDIHNTTTFATADGYMSIAKKVRELFHLELPRSKILQSEQICRKCFRALNEIHFLETQVSDLSIRVIVPPELRNPDFDLPP